MTKDDRIASYKYSVLQHARKHNNITDTCKVFHLSRTVYYKWLKRFSKLGYLGLQDKKKAKPKMPNQIKKNKEKIILNYIIEYPTPDKTDIQLSDHGHFLVFFRTMMPEKRM